MFSDLVLYDKWVMCQMQLSKTANINESHLHNKSEKSNIQLTKTNVMQYTISKP